MDSTQDGDSSLVNLLVYTKRARHYVYEAITTGMHGVRSIEQKWREKLQKTQGVLPSDRAPIPNTQHLRY